MGRIRTIKPEFFKHELLYDLEEEHKLPIRLAYIGLWTCCDREGRFRWQPRKLKLECLPYDDVSFETIMGILRENDFIRIYKDGEGTYGYIPTWHDHQIINNREFASTLPDPTVCYSNNK